MVLGMVKELESCSQLLYHFLCDFEQQLPSLEFSFHMPIV